MSRRFPGLEILKRKKNNRKSKAPDPPCWPARQYLITGNDVRRIVGRRSLVNGSQHDRADRIPSLLTSNENRIRTMADHSHRTRDRESTSDQATSVDVLSAWVSDARTRSLQLVMDLDDEQLIVPRLPIINPLLWEIGHAAWFQDYWILQHAAGQKPIQANGESLYDSIGIEHDLRWDLPLPPREHVFDYVNRVREAVLNVLNGGKLNDELMYFVKLSVFHEDMHTEAFTYTRQTLAYPEPTFSEGDVKPNVAWVGDGVSGDVEQPGGVLQLGASRDAAFVFDNEKWAHPVSIEPFAISRTAVTQQQFAEFVDADGYDRSELWTEAGWQWRLTSRARHPVYWQRNRDGWVWRHFDQWRPLDSRLPMIHVNWFEADAFCRWAQRRLPTESEWEFAAAGGSDELGESQAGKRHYPWGTMPPDSMRANLDWQAMGPVDTTAHVAGESPSGCRQLIGNVWEWTATTFEPYPGFSVDPYEEYSRPCFGNCQVLRGGCWATRSRLIRNTWRNYYQPDRRDVFAGFRTCALRT